MALSLVNNICSHAINPTQPGNHIPATVHAWVCRDYGGPGVLALQTRQRPAPGPSDVLIRVQAVSVSSADVRIRTQNLPRGFGLLGWLAFGLVRPHQPVLGADAAGVVASVGSQVQDFTQGTQRWDVIADTVGASTFAACLPHLKENGRYLWVAGSLMELLARQRGTRHTIGGPAPESAQGLQTVMDMAQLGALQPVIERIYPFAELPLAHAHAETGRKRGAAVVTWPA
jgi:NADPH:quinone reductase-like Zn-dependent oxidoreductase